MTKIWTVGNQKTLKNRKNCLLPTSDKKIPGKTQIAKTNTGWQYIVSTILLKISAKKKYQFWNGESRKKKHLFRVSAHALHDIEKNRAVGYLKTDCHCQE